ncbi:hypothetical protein L1887_30897 [Cichorium endivia]|nr:hypothetical protein L1887_30897 [Cichorium endivia]
MKNGSQYSHYSPFHLSLNTLYLSSSDCISPSSRFTIAICTLASLSYPTNRNDRDIKIFDNGDAEDAGGEDKDADTSGGGFRVDSHSSPPSIAPLVAAVNSITHRRSPITKVRVQNTHRVCSA